MTDATTSGIITQSQKRLLPPTEELNLPRKKSKALLANDDSDSEDSHGGVPLQANSDAHHVLSINQEFARRFEHNKRREESHRLEERFGRSSNVLDQQTSRGDSSYSSNGSTDASTDSEDEDDEGILASVAVDKQIQTTLDAIRSKDPRVYDKNAQFFAAYHSEEDHDGTHTGSVKEKPMYLSDYHRKNIQENVANLSEENQRATYVKHQDDLKSAVIREIRGAIEVASGNSAENPNGGQITDNEDDDFLVRKNPLLSREGEKKDPIAAPALDAEAADRDPESFLFNFMASRAWVPSAESKFQPFESDDDEEEQRAEQYEDAYNLRFEDPQKSNERLLSHARDAAAKYSIRREAVNGRKRAREIERAKKEAARNGRQEEKARLRKLRIAEAEEKIKKIKDAAGLRDKALQLEDWSAFLDEGWDDKRWEEEMKKRFGDTYYADYDYESNPEEPRHGKKTAKKPKWNNDLQINDLIPEFEADDKAKRLATEFVLTDDESPRRSALDARNSGQEIILEQNISKITSNKKSKKSHERMQNKQARVARRQVEWLVDQQLDVDQSLADVGPRHSRYFRYRETSPLDFGLTAQDILMASDSQLNQYAGLKKIASFREPEKKRKDKKRLGKKTRLRKWRKDTFGDEHGLQKTLNDVLTSQTTLNPAPARKKGEGNGIGQISRGRQSKNVAIER
ncbi:MAG: hypothetical protein Q9214_005439 [Letrouitia sp. 1 TL-2023]